MCQAADGSQDVSDTAVTGCSSHYTPEDLPATSVSASRPTAAAKLRGGKAPGAAADGGRGEVTSHANSKPYLPLADARGGRDGGGGAGVEFPAADPRATRLLREEREGGGARDGGSDSRASNASLPRLSRGVSAACRDITQQKEREGERERERERPAGSAGERGGERKERHLPSLQVKEPSLTLRLQRHPPPPPPKEKHNTRLQYTQLAQLKFNSATPPPISHRPQTPSPRHRRLGEHDTTPHTPPPPLESTSPRFTFVSASASCSHGFEKSKLLQHLDEEPHDHEDCYDFKAVYVHGRRVSWQGMSLRPPPPPPASPRPLR